MEILRIPSAYYTQIQFLNREDSEYVLKTIFALSFWEKIKVEQSMRGWLVVSIWREAIQMENKARAKKWEERLNEDLATLSCDTDDTLWSSKDATKSSQVKENQIKSNQERLIEKNIWEFQNVKITEEEKNKLYQKYGRVTADNFIKRLSCYIEQQGKDKYKNHYAVIISWMLWENIQPIHVNLAPII